MNISVFRTIIADMGIFCIKDRKNCKPTIMGFE